MQKGQMRAWLHAMAFVGTPTAERLQGYLLSRNVASATNWAAGERLAHKTRITNQQAVWLARELAGNACGKGGIYAIPGFAR